jgi:hypothetical protein
MKFRFGPKVVSRLLIGLAICGAMTMPAKAQLRSAGGEWTGKYVCRQGVTGARLILSEDGSRGVFHFFPLPENPRVPEGCFQVTGVFNSTSGALAVIPGTWYLKPRNFVSVTFNGTVDQRGENFEGKIVGLDGCASVFLSRAAPTQPLPSVCARGLP